MISSPEVVYEELVKLSEDVNYKEQFMPKLSEILGINLEENVGDRQVLLQTLDSAIDMLAKHLIRVRIGEYGDSRSIADILNKLAQLRWQLNI